MTTAGKLECRFFWEYLNDGYLIFDRQRGAGCFGENFIAAAIDLDAAETMCELMNLAGTVKVSRKVVAQHREARFGGAGSGR